MQHYTLGVSGIEVPPIFIGGMSFGVPSSSFHEWTVEQRTTNEVLARAFEHGLNAIDTANVYGHGTSEEFIGTALRDLGVAREDVVLASKVFFNEGHCSRGAIMREIEGSLARLGTDYLDLYILHRFDYSTPIEETMEALHDLVTEGKVRAIGASEMYAHQFHDMIHTAQVHDWTVFSSLQCHHNLLYREGERELLPVARQYDVLPTPYSPLASGHLVRPTWEGSSKRAATDKVVASKYDTEQAHSMPIVERVHEIAQRRGASMAMVALAWHWVHGPSSPIVGFSSPARVDEAVAALDLSLTAEEVAFLEEPYVARALVGPLARPGEAPLAGTTNVGSHLK